MEETRYDPRVIQAALRVEESLRAAYNVGPQDMVRNPRRLARTEGITATDPVAAAMETLLARLGRGDLICNLSEIVRRQLTYTMDVLLPYIPSQTLADAYTPETAACWTTLVLACITLDSVAWFAKVRRATIRAPRMLVPDATQAASAAASADAWRILQYLLRHEPIDVGTAVELAAENSAIRALDVLLRSPTSRRALAVTAMDAAIHMYQVRAIAYIMTLGVFDEADYWAYFISAIELAEPGDARIGPIARQLAHGFDSTDVVVTLELYPLLQRVQAYLPELAARLLTQGPVEMQPNPAGIMHV